MKLAEWADTIDDGLEKAWRDRCGSFLSAKELQSCSCLTYSENDRFCQVSSMDGPAARKILPDLEDYTLMNVQYGIHENHALFSFQRKQKPVRNKVTPWKLRSR